MQRSIGLLAGGHYGTDVTQGMTITQEQADNLLIQDLKTYEADVRRICNYLDLNQNEFDALVSFTYNCGSGNLLKLTKSQTRTKQEISDHIEAYNKGANGLVLAGLVRRRKEEKELFLTPITSAKEEAKEMLTLEEALYYLDKNKILSNVDYWRNASNCVKHLDTLIIKFANSVATRDTND